MAIQKSHATNSEIVVEIHFWGVYQQSALALETEFKKKAQGFKVLKWSTLEEAMKVLVSGLSCIFIMSYNTDDELNNLMTFLTAIKDNKNPGQKLRTIVLNKNNTPKIIRKLVQEGANKVIQGTSSYSAIKAILNDFSNNLAKSLKSEMDLLHGQAQALNSQNDGVDKEVGKPAEKWNLLKPLTSASDCWFYLKEEPPRKILKSWHLSLEGPTPEMGEWVEHEQSVGPNVKLWHFVGKEHLLKDYIPEEGIWTFIGVKPEFKRPHWNFKSEKPQLSFFDLVQKKSTNARFLLDESGVLSLADNSEHSLACREMLKRYYEALDSERPRAKNKEGDEGDIADLTPVILIFEDDEDVQNYLKLFFYDFTVECKSVASSEDYLFLVKNEKPSFCIIDLNLHGNDRMGLSLVKATREALGLRVPIIMISASQDAEVQKKAFELGINEYILKPLFKDVLNEKLKDFLKILEVAEWKKGESEHDNYHRVELFNKKKNNLMNTAGREKPLVLVVDDDPVFLALVKSKLNSLNFDCETRENSESFLPEVKPLKPDFCIVDLNLDMEGEGYFIILAIRKVIGDELPLIVISARNDEASIQRAKSAGANEYLKKPLNSEELKMAVAKYDFRNKISKPDSSAA